MSKIWFVTGSSRGFGGRFAEAALERGDQVVATARQAEPMPVYAPVRDAVNARFAGLPQADASDVGAALLNVVDAEQPPLRVFFGTLPMQVVPPLYAQRLKTWEQWAGVAAQADGGGNV